MPYVDVNWNCTKRNETDRKKKRKKKWMGICECLSFSIQCESPHYCVNKQQAEYRSLTSLHNHHHEDMVNAYASWFSLSEGEKKLSITRCYAFVFGLRYIYNNKCSRRL